MGALMSFFTVNILECVGCITFSIISSALNSTLAQAARFGHTLLLILVVSVAAILGTHYPYNIKGLPIEYFGINISSECDFTRHDECVYRQLIYRSSFSMVLLYFLLAILTVGSDYINKHFWSLKFILALGAFVGTLWLPNIYFTIWAEFSRYLSFFWLLVQGLLFVDIAHNVHEYLMDKADEADRLYQNSRIWYIIYLIISFSTWIGSIISIGLLYHSYKSYQYSILFITITLICGVLTSIISILNCVNKGILTPSFIFLYSVFMCWYALQSSPDVLSHNSFSIYLTENVSMGIVVFLSSLVIIYCITAGSSLINLFRIDDDGTNQIRITEIPLIHKTNYHSTSTINTMEPQISTERIIGGEDHHTNTHNSSSRSTSSSSNSGTWPERIFYHIFLMIVSCYVPMMLTNWSDSHESTVEDDRLAVSTHNMWLKIVSQWITLLIYGRILQVSFTTDED